MAAGCFGCNSAVWQAVQPDIAQFAHTIAFDPAGYAWSDPGPPITPQTMADDLYATLTALGEDEVILVGFSAAKQIQGPMPDTIKDIAYYELVSESAQTRTALRIWASQYSPANHNFLHLSLPRRRESKRWMPAFAEPAPA